MTSVVCFGGAGRTTADFLLRVAAVERHRRALGCVCCLGIRTFSKTTLFSSSAPCNSPIESNRIEPPSEPSGVAKLVPLTVGTTEGWINNRNACRNVVMALLFILSPPERNAARPTSPVPLVVDEQDSLPYSYSLSIEMGRVVSAALLCTSRLHVLSRIVWNAW